MRPSAASSSTSPSSSSAASRSRACSDLVGPPGVGKTSFARAVARALNRPFAVLSLGGVDDEVQIRGFERTYIRSRPGRVIRAIVKAGVMNPVMLLDEIDKLGRRWSDPAAALLELLDPETNTSFVDSYLQFGFDFSHTLFICSANSAEQIDAILRNRMEVIELDGYTARDKLVLAQKHIVPAAVTDVGPDAGLARLHRGGAGPARARVLGRAGRARAGARRDPDLPRTSTAAPPPARSRSRSPSIRPGPRGPRQAARRPRRALERLPPGCAYGLSWTASDGELLPIECAVLPHGTGKLVVTGQLGDVLKESIEIAIAVLRRSADRLGVSAGFRDGHDLRVHLPDGATKKEGPSAGLAIAIALLSHLRGRPVRGDTTDDRRADAARPRHRHRRREDQAPRGGRREPHARGPARGQPARRRARLPRRGPARRDRLCPRSRRRRGRRVLQAASRARAARPGPR